VRKQSEESPVNGRADGENVVRGGADEIKPLEIRAINHLVNEYLLERDYKLSSITFSDENEEQVRSLSWTLSPCFCLKFPTFSEICGQKFVAEGYCGCDFKLFACPAELIG